MGLLTIIRKARLKEKQVRILMLCVVCALSRPPHPPPVEPRLLRSGLDNAGKTTICKAILGEDVDEVSPTLGFNIRTIVHQGFTLNVCESAWASSGPGRSRAARAPSSHACTHAARSLSLSSPGDIGGQTSLRPYWRNYFEQTDAVVWVVDSSDRARMEDCRRELHELLKEEVGLQFLPRRSFGVSSVG